MADFQTHLIEPLLRITSTPDQKLSVAINILRETFDLYPLRLSPILVSCFLTECFGKQGRLVVLSFLGQLHLLNISLPSQTFRIILGKLAPHEKVLLYEIIVKNNIETVGLLVSSSQIKGSGR